MLSKCINCIISTNIKGKMSKLAHLAIDVPMKQKLTLVIYRHYDEFLYIQKYYKSVIPPKYDYTIDVDGKKYHYIFIGTFSHDRNSIHYTDNVSIDIF